MRKEGEKAAKGEQKRIAKQEKQKSRETNTSQKTEVAEPKVIAPEGETASATEAHDTPIVRELPAEETIVQEPTVDQPAADEPSADKSVVDKSARDDDTTPKLKGYVAPAGLRTSMEVQTEERLSEIIKEGEKSPNSPDSSKGVKNWLKTKFRRQSKTQKIDSKDTGIDKEVISGNALAEVGNTSVEPNTPSEKHEVAGKSSMEEEVTIAGHSSAKEEPVEMIDEERTGRSKRRASSVSSVSALEESQDMGKEVSKDDDFEEARDHFDNDLTPPPTFPATKSASPVRDSKFHEEM